MSYHSGNQLINPHVLFEKTQLDAAMHVADFGAGRTGHVVFPAARIVGEQGVVYAVDILKDVLMSVEKRARLEGFLNVHTVWADIESPGGVRIPEHSLDVIFAINLLYHFKKYTNTLSEAARLLKEKGRLAIVDWVMQLANVGPDPGAMVDFNRLIAEARAHGFVVQEDVSHGKYHRALILYRSP